MGERNDVVPHILISTCSIHVVGFFCCSHIYVCVCKRESAREIGPLDSDLFSSWHDGCHYDLSKSTEHKSELIVSRAGLTYALCKQMLLIR